MKREEKYPETKYFKYYNANPKNRITGDCVFRAISNALDQTWEQTVMEMAEFSCKTGYAINDKKGIERYLKSKGWVKYKQPRKEDGTKYTGKEFCEEIQTHRRWYEPQIVAMIGGHHIVSIMWGQVQDIWDCTNKTVGNYWMRS